MGAGATRSLVLAAAAAAVLAACEPVVQVHGYAPSPAQLDQVQPGVDSAAMVAQKIGRPSTAGVIRDDAWYYVSSRVETMAYNAPEVTDRRVVAVSFDGNGVVEGVESFGLEEGRVVTLVTRTTPTFGRELTVLQQIFGNLGNIGSDTFRDLAPGG
jgi:outer membrane protein assembly factor BamE (lipoprotein component of BamABCDE complex)